MQSARDSLLKQISELCVSGSRLCFDLIHEDALMGRKEYVGYKAGAKVRPNLCSSWTSPVCLPDLRHALLCCCGVLMLFLF